MKKIRSFVFILGTALMLCISCGGDDQPTPSGLSQDSNGQGYSNTPAVQTPTIVESSIACDFAQKIIYFNAVCPAGGKIQVLIYPQDNESEEVLLDVSYRSISQLYSVNIQELVPGSTYHYYVICYNSQGKEVLRSEKHTLTMPKNAAPLAPSVNNIQAYGPTTIQGADGYLEGNVITLDMEYSIDDGETWIPVEEAGFIRNLRPGKVLLRLAETPTTEAGLSAEVTVPEHKSNTDPDGDKGTSEGLKSRKRK